ncbi:aldo/keto reductase [Gordonia desulfuricans]|uniref:Aldo/keto reductase n=1 Tax=Gordonia desulfuricans TaxID=89051 RepID=A0A7K3LMI0_9ACTN|nr:MULTISPECIES: aldo/keto reductase [Gordonia]EMP13241.1 oxidoreductase [Gordonia sp. NB41Y]NDK89464.1 aldo/keto reductase [Gordonia desulfuricans]WLP89836.1 aldo/keto reductase [Gordonia sp. NB41Y]
MTVPSITLNNGVEIPQLGFGVFQITPEDTAEATLTALEIGYRHIDTAQMYGNERQVGEALAKSGISRDEVFITTKLNNSFHDYDAALAETDRSLERLGVDAVDLYLIHWPMPGVGDFVQTWKALEKVYADGKARAIGVSNFQAAHLERLFAETDVVPAVNQIEVHPYLTQAPLRAFDAQHQIATEAWSPIAQGDVLDDPVLERIAAEVGRSTAQVTLRWHIQRGDIVFPKSVTRSRVEENFALFDFELSAEQIAAIDALNKDKRRGPDPDTFNWVP